MSYLDKEVENVIKVIGHQIENKKIKWDKIRIRLHQLIMDAFKEGVYSGKS